MRPYVFLCERYLEKIGFFIIKIQSHLVGSSGGLSLFWLVAYFEHEHKKEFVDNSADPEYELRVSGLAV